MNANIPLTQADLQQARRLCYEAALQTLAALPPASAARPETLGLRAQLQAERDQTGLTDKTSLLPALLAGDTAGLAGKVGSHLLARLGARIAEAAGQDQAEVSARMQAAFAAVISAGPRWRTFSRAFEVGGQRYTSEFTPLNRAFDPAFADYGFTGYASPSAYLPVGGAAPLETRARATNAWRTRFWRDDGDDGQVLLTAFRSGSFSELGVPDPTARMALARAKAGDLLRAAAVEHFKRRSAAEQQAAREGAAVSEIPFVSTSLLTSFLGGFNHQTLQEHAAALEEFHGRQTTVDVFHGGQKRSIAAYFYIINFNTAVNELRWVGASRSRLQLAMNAEALRRLRDLVERGLERLEARHAAHPADALAAQIARVRQLWERVVAVTARRGWLSSGSGSAYELPALVSNLGYQLGAQVHYNCLSGKDRTGMADVESKLLAYQLDRRTRDARRLGTPLERARLVPRYADRLVGDEAEAAVRLIFEGGNLDIQQINTGVPGYKIRGALLGRDGGRLGRILAASQGQAVIREYLNVNEQVSVKAEQFSRMINALSAYTGA